jgi:pyruvate/2-oxoglutarate/acetoin dehydrogenase E1 component
MIFYSPLSFSLLSSLSFERELLEASGAVDTGAATTGSAPLLELQFRFFFFVGLLFLHAADVSTRIRK